MPGRSVADRGTPTAQSFTHLLSFLLSGGRRLSRAGRIIFPMATIRAFVALEIGVEVCDRLRTVQRTLQAEGADAAWVKPESLHLTLKFLDEVPEKHVPQIAQALVSVAARYHPFTLAVVGLGAFPSEEHPRVIWAGIEEGAETVGKLTRDVERALVALGFPPTDKPFHAHLTLGRLRNGTRIHALGRTIERTRTTRYGEAAIAEIRLMRSELSPNGARHTVLATVPLSKGPGDAGRM
jgi:RNA 2',3'-cyclic 3'-phosphodiesterase